MKNIFIIIFLTLIYSCEKEIKIDQKKYPPKIVLNSIINPNSNKVFVKLSESRDMLYDLNNFPAITNATIELLDNNTSVGFLTHLSNGQYFILYTVIPTHKYTLKVTNTKLDDVSATTIVPTPASLTNYSAVLDQNLKADIDITFIDPPNETNYYNLSIKRLDTLKIPLQNVGGGDYYIQPHSSYFCSSDPAIEYPNNDGVNAKNCGNSFYFSDKIFENSSYTFNAEFESTFYNYSNNNTDTLFTEIILNYKTLNYDYYQYKISSGISNENYGNPFAEPVRIYSNINNGFGIFGSYNTYIDTLTF